MSNAIDAVLAPPDPLFPEIEAFRLRVDAGQYQLLPEQTGIVVSGKNSPFDPLSRKLIDEEGQVEEE